VIYNVTFGYSGQGIGWGETHAMLSANDDPSSLLPTLTDIANKRVQFLGREFAIVVIRAARYATDAGVRTRGVTPPRRVNITNSVRTAVAAAEPGNVCLNVVGSALPSIVNPQFNANVNRTFCGAPPDDAVNNAGVVDPGKAGLGAAFASWRSAMIQGGLGWLASQTIYQHDIVSIVGNDNGTVTFTFPDFTPTLTVGTLYRCRVKGVNNRRSPLNGELVVRAATATTLVTQEIIGLALDQVGGSMRVYKAVSPFIGYGDLTLSLQAGTHKRGRPFGSLPGRARARVRG
jgi:hypothetical protein